MREISGDIFKLLESNNFDGFCITTNGSIKSNGECVMGRGIALTCKQMFPNIPMTLGNLIRIRGNHVHKLGTYKSYTIFSFPVKHNWWEVADIELIKRSCVELTQMLDKLHLKSVLLPRPGCGNGKLDWQLVKPVIAKLLDDRVIVATF